MSPALLNNEIIINSTLEDMSNVISLLDNIISNSENRNIIVLLDGDLSSGKTTLVQKYTSIYCNDTVTSPTFSIIHEYGENIFHYDLYQKKWSQLLSMGVIEFLAQDGIHFIEWPNKELRDSLDSFDIHPININIAHKTTNNREYKITYE